MTAKQIDYSRLPGHMQEGARLYVEKGVMPGGFLFAVLANDLVEAFKRADFVNTEQMKEWAAWLFSQCPAAAWGSSGKIDYWCNAGGIEGLFENFAKKVNADGAPE